MLNSKCDRNFDKKYDENPIQLGLCCMNIELGKQKPKIYASRTIYLKHAVKNGLDEVKRRVILNLEDLKKMIIWNHQNNINVFRISSNIFPLKTHMEYRQFLIDGTIPKKLEGKIDTVCEPSFFDNMEASETSDAYSFDFAKDLLKEVGDLAKSLNQRITMHPDQFNVVGSPNKSAYDNTVRSLRYQATMLDLMGLDSDSVMVVHGGGVHNDKKATMNRWCKQFYELPQNVQNRLVLENCERCYSIEDCLDISSRINIPVVLDSHHFDCFNIIYPNNNLHPMGYYIP